MTKKKRELLKFRPGDCGLKIKKDGAIEIAGVDDSGGMIDKKGMVNPALLFAAAWARRYQKVFQVLIDNFKESLREGYFGPDAKQDFERALKVQEDEKAKKPDPPFLNPDTKPTVSTSEPSLGDEFETSSSKPTVSTTAAASGAVTFEQPSPLTTQGHLDKRDGILVNGIVLDEKGVENEDK